jgi:simple sugar transport system permease protein
MSEIWSTMTFLTPLFIASMVPLSIVALGGLFSERSGVVNIALEGIMVMGAFVGIIVMRVLIDQTNLPLQMIAFLGLLMGALIGLIYSWFHAFASITMKSNQIISATALNLFAPALSVFIARIFYGTSNLNLGGNYTIRRVPLLSEIPIFGPLFFTNAYLSTYLGVVIFIVATIILYKTKLGLRLRACGENPHAADSLGINVTKIRYIGVLTSGALAGLGGVIFVLSFATQFRGTVSGFGFLALAVMIFGQWKPKRILIVALFFATIRVIANAYTAIPVIQNFTIPSEIYSMLPYIATLVVLAIASKNSQAPAAAGEPYEAGKR